MVLTTLLSIWALVLFLIFYWSRRKQMRIFKKLGIPGPEPNFLFGNLLAFKSKPMFRKYQEWRQEFGETYGYFEGPTPVLVTSNVDLIQEVFIKQFNKFHARKLWPVQVDPDRDEDVHMFFAKGKRWKRLRNVVNPAFSAAKIRQMAPTVNDSINHLLDVIKKDSKIASDHSLEVLGLFRRLTLDSILRCEVGLDHNSVKNPDDPFLTHCKGVIDDTTKMPWLYLLGFLFPTLHSVWIAIYKFLHNIKFNPVFWLEDRMREVITMRRQCTESKRCDLMQQMLDAQFKADSFKDIESEREKGDPSRGNTLRSMTNEEIVSHALLFLLAGYETTSTTLTYLFFELSQNPHVQQCLRREIMSVLPRGYCEIQYDDLKQLTYLDYVIWEALRKYPLASSVTARQCVQPCTIQGIEFPEGLLVHANLWDVQYDPKHWGDNPQQFDPLRFLPENRKTRHPAAWMPFGAGPRSCAGLRFALLQLKMVVAKVLRDFDFQPSEQQTLPLRLVEGATVLPADGVQLSALRRASAMTDAGLRRASSVLGISAEDLASLAGVVGGSRRASMVTNSASSSRRPSFANVAEEFATEDDGANLENNECNDDAEMEAAWKMYLARRRKPPRRNSFLDDEPTRESICDIRRASICRGADLLQPPSLLRLGAFRRASCGPVLEKPGTIRHLNTYLKPPSSTTSVSPGTTPKSTTVPSPGLLKPNNNVEQNKDSDEEVLPGVSQFMKARYAGRRRASALPDLESVGESLTIAEFNPRHRDPSYENIDNSQVNLEGPSIVITDDDYSDELMKNGCSRLYKRRASG